MYKKIVVLVVICSLLIGVLQAYATETDYEYIKQSVTKALTTLKDKGYDVTYQMLEKAPDMYAQEAKKYSLTKDEEIIIGDRICNSIIMIPQRLKYIIDDDEVEDKIKTYYEQDILPSREKAEREEYVFEGEEPSFWARDGVVEAINLGIVPEELLSDYTKGITREEFASLFVNAVFVYQKNELGNEAVTREDYLESVTATDYTFTDVNNEDIKLAYIMGFVNGTSSTTFSPDKVITRQEAAVMLVNYFQMGLSPAYEENESKIIDLDEAAEWARESISAAYTGYYFEGTSGKRDDPESKITISPLATFTREQAIVIALRIYKKHPLVPKLRGVLKFTEECLDVEWEVSKTEITAVKFKEGHGLSESFRREIFFYNDAKDYSDASDEMVFAATYKSYLYIYSIIPSEVVVTGLKGENAVFDLGWAEYEMLGEGFIFNYKLKYNGLHTWSVYGGSKELPVEWKRIK